MRLKNEPEPQHEMADALLRPLHARPRRKDPAMRRNDEPEPQHETAVALLHHRVLRTRWKDPASELKDTSEARKDVAAALLPPRRHRPGSADPPMMLKDQPQHDLAAALPPPVEAWPQLTETLVLMQIRCEAGARLPVVCPTAMCLA